MAFFLVRHHRRAASNGPVDTTPPRVPMSVSASPPSMSAAAPLFPSPSPPAWPGYASAYGGTAATPPNATMPYAAYPYPPPAPDGSPLSYQSSTVPPPDRPMYGSGARPALPEL
jgi:hypothetical protein